jgi:hypothetical protein
MIIGSDVDDVLYGWYRAAHQICESAGITNGVTPTQWAVQDDYGCSKELWLETLVNAGDTLYYFDPMPGVLEALNRIVDAGHDLVLITARGSFGPNGEQIKEWTRAWMEYWEIPGDIIFSPDKTVFKTDWFLDDRADHVDALLAVGTKARLHDQPWNASARHLDNVRRMNVTEYVDEILA